MAAIRAASLPGRRTGGLGVVVHAVDQADLRGADGVDVVAGQRQARAGGRRR
ncbi:hypothetical protein [Nocardioides convexus]|uniref:hypothetical protein n=1 Tax=Nocardioides convexus TaxID=2712224 RepID=UPI002418AB7B|nr:hypothetical protein [Nocardioides convexus]